MNEWNGLLFCTRKVKNRIYFKILKNWTEENWKFHPEYNFKELRLKLEKKYLSIEKK